MMKKFQTLGKLGSHLFNTGKNYFKGGGKTTKTIMTESNVSKEVAKADIKSEIKRKAFPRGGKKPSDFYNKPKGR
jgi:hypothetical protein